MAGKHAKDFEKCLAKVLGKTLKTVSELLYGITKMLSPAYLQEAHVSKTCTYVYYTYDGIKKKPVNTACIIYHEQTWKMCDG